MGLKLLRHRTLRNGVVKRILGWRRVEGLEFRIHALSRARRRDADSGTRQARHSLRNAAITRVQMTFIFGGGEGRI